MLCLAYLLVLPCSTCQYSSAHPELVAKLFQSFYVGDLVCGGSNDVRNFSFVRKAPNHASFNLRKFTSSSHTLREKNHKKIAQFKQGDQVDYLMTLMQIIHVLQSQNCFTDLQISLCWIKGTDKDWKPYIQNLRDSTGERAMGCHVLE